MIQSSATDSFALLVQIMTLTSLKNLLVNSQISSSGLISIIKVVYLLHSHYYQLEFASVPVPQLCCARPMRSRRHLPPFPPFLRPYFREPFPANSTHWPPNSKLTGPGTKTALGLFPAPSSHYCLTTLALTNLYRLSTRCHHSQKCVANWFNLFLVQCCSIGMSWLENKDSYVLCLERFASPSCKYVNLLEKHELFSSP